MPKDTFQRFVDYTTEEDRKAEQREKEAAKIAALKKASFEKTKTWDTTIAVRLSSFDSVFCDVRRKIINKNYFIYKIQTYAPKNVRIIYILDLLLYTNKLESFYKGFTQIPN